MKKLFSSPKVFLVICSTLVFSFFLPFVLKGEMPFPADTILGLYHPWRDEPHAGYLPEKFPVKNPLITDPVLQTYPWRLTTIKNLKNKFAPLWNPYSFLGQPLLANIQSSPLQVLNVFYFFLPFNLAWTLNIILGSVLTSAFMFLFLRKNELSPQGSLFGALVLPFSGFFMSWLTWGNIVQTAMWLPLILLSIKALSDKVSALWFFTLTFCVFQTIVSGHWQTAFYVICASLLYQVYIFVKNRKLCVWTLLAFLLGILIASVQILPSLEFINNSARSTDQGYFPQKEDWFLPVKHLVQAIAPDFFGNPTKYNYWGIWNYSEFVSYIGVIPFCLAIYAVFKKIKDSYFWIILLILSLLAAVENPISKIPYILNLPFISTMQPSRIIFLFVFTLSILSAYGFDEYFKNKLKKKDLLAPILLAIVLFSLFALTFLPTFFVTNDNLSLVKISQRNLIFPTLMVIVFLLISLLRLSNRAKKIVIILTFALTLGDLFRFGYRYTPFVKSSSVFPQTQVESFLSKQEKPFRIIATDRRIFPPNSTIVSDLESVSGYDPLFLKDYATFVSSWNSNKTENAGSFNRIVTPQNIDSKLTDLVNAKFVITFDEISSPKFEKVFEEGATKIYKNNSAQERAFFAKEVIQTVSGQEALSHMLDSQTDLKNTAYSSEFGHLSQNSAGRIEFLAYNDQNFSLRTEADEDKTLVVTNAFYPGWVAKIDGRNTPVYKTNFMFLGIVLPKGKHIVDFQFKSKSYENGLYLSLSGLLLFLIINTYIWRKYR